MKKILGSVAAIGLLAGLAAPAYAQMATTAPAPAADAMTFAGADTNGDGMIDKSEARNALPAFGDEEFAQIDANADGMLDETEFAALQALATGSDEEPESNIQSDESPNNTSN